MAAAQNSPLPEALTRAVHHVFGEWTALCMAVENDWGGQNTRDKALTLLERTLQALNTPVVHRDEVEAFLEDALVEDFNIEAEDESPRQVAEGAAGPRGSRGGSLGMAWHVFTLRQAGQAP